MRKPILNTLVQILGKAGMVGISLITTGILTRKLGVNGYGNFVLISSLFVFLDSLADFGTKTIGVREMSKKDGERKAGQIFNLRLIMTMISFGIGMLLILNWKGIADIKVEAMVALIMIYLTSVAGFLEMLFQSKMRMDLKVIMDLCFPLLFLVWLWWWKGEINLLAVISVYLIARGISLGIGFYLVTGLSKIEIIKIDSEEIKRIWQMTWPMGVFLIMFAAYDRAIDALIIQNYLGSNQVAWYGLAYKIYGVMLQPAYFYVNSIFPMMSMSNKDMPKRKLFNISAGLLFTGALLVIILVTVLAPLMINILAGAEYQQSIKVLRILIVAALFSYLGHLFGFTLISQGGQKEMLKLGGMAMLFNLFGNMLLVPPYGIVAAAWVTVMTEALDCGMMGWFLCRRIKY